MIRCPRCSLPYPGIAGWVYRDDYYHVTSCLMCGFILEDKTPDRNIGADWKYKIRTLNSYYTDKFGQRHRHYVKIDRW